jgi:CHAD domain-containing protein
VLKRKRYAALPDDIRNPANYRAATVRERCCSQRERSLTVAARPVFLRKRLEKLENWRRRGDSFERLHRLRIQFKKLRYTAEFFALFELGLRKLADFARRFQNILGDYHDAVVLEQELERAARDHGDELLRSAMESARADQRALKAQFRKLWSRRRIRRLREQIEDGKKRTGERKN